MDEKFYYYEVLCLFALIRHLLDCISLDCMLSNSVYIYDFSVKYSYLCHISSEN